MAVVIAIIVMNFQKGSDYEYFTMGTGGVVGVYYPVGGATAKLINDSNDDMRVTVESTGGSVFNIKAMAQQELDLALAQSDVVYQAYHGQQAFEEQPVNEVRSLMGLHAEPTHLVCSQRSGVETFEEIRGKRVNLGNPGSGILNTVRAIFEAYDINEDEDINAEYLRAAEAPDFLRDNRIDCFFYVVGIGGAAIEDIASTTDINLIALDGEELEALIEEKPYYAFATVPGGTYNGVEEDVTIFGVKALFTTTTYLDEERAYRIVKTILDNLESFQQAHSALSKLTQKDFLGGLGAPLHEGAKRAYREAGMELARDD